MEKLKDRVDLYSVLLIGLTTLFVYLNSITGEFVFDDWPLIKEHFMIHSLANWKTILIQGYRPVRTLFLAFLYHLFGLNPVGYHLVNIAIHMLASIAVYFFCVRLVQKRDVAIFSAMIFAVHPIQTDAVSYISGIRDTLNTFLYVTSMYFFVRYRQSGHWIVLVFSILFYVLGAFTKEMAATVLFAFFLYDYVMAVDLGRSRSLTDIFKNSVGTALKVILSNKILYGSLFLFFCFMLYYYLLMRPSTPRVQPEGIYWYGGSMLLNYLAIPKIIIYYIKQLIWPVHLLVDYKYFPIVPANPYEPQAILSIMVVSEIMLVTLYLLNRHKIVAFGLLFFLLTLTPVLNILPHHEFMAEHYLYLPMVGFSIVLGSLFATVANKAPTRRQSIAVVLAFVVLIVAYSARTVLRNMDWQNDLQLIDAQLKIRPKSARALIERGYLYLYMNLPHSAEEEFRESLRIKPGYGLALNNLGQVSLKYAEYEKAIEYYRQASESRVHPASKARQNMGLVFMSLRKKDEGKAIFNKILKRDTNHRAALISMAYAHFFDGELEQAAKYLRRNLRNHPADIEAYFLLAEVYRKRFLFEKAEILYDIILDIEHDNKKAVELKQTVQQSRNILESIKKMEEDGLLPPDGYLLRTDLYVRVQEYEEAVKALEEAMGFYPDHLGLWRKYAWMLLVQHRFKEALEASRKAVTIDPQDGDSRLLLARSYVAQLDFNNAAAEVSFIEKQKTDINGLDDVKKLIANNAEKKEKAKQLLTKNEDDPEGGLLLGEAYVSLGLIDKAIEQYKEILVNYPEHQEARYHLARMHLRKNSPLDIQEAMRLLRTILDENPNHSDAHNLMGAIYLVKLDNFESAYQHFEESLRSDPLQKEAGQIQKTAAALRHYIRAVTVEKKYLLPFVVEEKQFEKWLMPAVTTTAIF